MHRYRRWGGQTGKEIVEEPFTNSWDAEKAAIRHVPGCVAFFKNGHAQYLEEFDEIVTISEDKCLEIARHYANVA